MKTWKLAVALTVSVVVALTTGGCTTTPEASAQTDEGASAASGVAPLVVRVEPAKLETGFEQTRRYRGEIEARRRSQVGFDQAGTLTRVRVDEGDRVERGQLLAELDTSRWQAQQRRLAAAVEEAETALALSTSTLERFERAAQRNAVSPQDVDEARRSRDAAAAALERTQAEAELIDVELRKARLVAPYRALVIQRLVDEGQVLGSGTPALELVEIDRPRARIALPLRAAALLDDAEELAVEVAGQERVTRRVAVVPVQDERTRTVDLLVEFDEPLGELRLGETATLQLQDALPGEGFVLPLSALTESSRGLWSAYVVTQSDDEEGARRVEQRAVEVVELETTGANARALVRGALQEGDLVVQDGLQRLTPGLPVRIGEQDEETTS